MAHQHHVHTLALCLLSRFRGCVDTDHFVGVIQKFDDTAGLYLLVVELILLPEKATHCRIILIGVIFKLKLDAKASDAPKQQI